MRTRIALSVLLTGCWVALGGCSETTVEPPPISCVDGPYRAELHVDASDPRLVWATDYETVRDVAVRPRPPGRFTFDPARPASVLDSKGKVVTFDGEITMTGCFDALHQTVYVGPADVPDPNRPPN